MASTMAVVHVRVEERVKAKAAKALAAMGLSVSDAVRVLLTRVAAEKALPFDVKVPNATTRAAMAELERGGLKSYATFAEAMADDDAPHASKG
jgi:DNA-damage-inducible protein J